MSARTLEKLSQADDPKQALIDAVGDISDIEIMYGKLLVAIYIAPEKTKSGIIRPQSNVREDVWQGTVGLCLAKGPIAFKGDDFAGQEVKVGDWILFRPGDTARLQIRGVNLRLIDDTLVQAIIPNPEIVTHESV